MRPPHHLPKLSFSEFQHRPCSPAASDRKLAARTRGSRAAQASDGSHLEALRDFEPARGFPPVSSGQGGRRPSVAGSVWNDRLDLSPCPAIPASEPRPDRNPAEERLETRFRRDFPQPRVSLSPGRDPAAPCAGLGLGEAVRVLIGQAAGTPPRTRNAPGGYPRA
jgi:hypothetical protein